MNFFIFAVTLLCLSSFSAEARDECVLGLNPGHVAYGSSTRAALLAQRGPGEADASFGVRSVQLRIQCPTARPITWQFIADAADSLRYRWGAGTMQMSIVAARLDGVGVQWALASGEPVGATLLRPGDRFVPWRAGAIALGTHLEVELEIEALVSDSASRVSDLTRFEGRGSFQLN